MSAKQDVQNFYRQLVWSPEIDVRIEDSSESIVCGMGGSGLAARILKNISANNVTLHQTYGLPQYSGKPLVIISSYSGNTEEALSSYDAAQKASLKIVVVTAGGELLERAEKEGYQSIVLPEVSQPRYAVGYSLIAHAAILGVDLAIDGLTSPDDIDVQELINYFSDGLPVLWGTSQTSSAAYIWKILFNESAKRFSTYNSIPELNHNEFVGLEQLGSLQSELKVLLLSNPESEDRREHLRVLKTEELLQSRGIHVKKRILQGSSPASKIIQEIQLAMIVTFNSAVLHGVDPEPIEIVEDFKKLLHDA
jgi:glucose/mannose-6-phosphate isomerase